MAMLGIREWWAPFTLLGLDFSWHHKFCLFVLTNSVSLALASFFTKLTAVCSFFFFKEIWSILGWSPEWGAVEDAPWPVLVWLKWGFFVVVQFAFLNQYKNANFSHELCLIVKSSSVICLLEIIHKVFCFFFCEESNLTWEQLASTPPMNRISR